MTPTERILEQIMEAQKKHWERAETGFIVGRCALDRALWPCDASLLARQMEEAVKALEKIESTDWHECLCDNVAREALSRIAALASEEKT